MFTKFKYKIGKIIFSNFPLNSIRIFGLRMCGIKVGHKVYIGPGLVITMPNAKSSCSLTIEDRVAIAPQVTFVLESNANWSKLNSIILPIQGKIIVEHDSWIGTGSIILPNITIGEMSVIGAGSVVTKDVMRYSIVAGVPAVEVKKIRE
jgi:acetyltransferase-like isoleucine patch superfamily enzyme